MAGRSFGKSAVSMYCASRLSCYDNKLTYIIGPTRKQQVEIMWEQPDGIKSFLTKESHNAHVLESPTRIELPWKSGIKIDGSEMHQGYRGVAYDMMIIDEAQDIDWRFYDAAYPNLSKRNGILVLIGTITQDLSNPFMKLWEQAKKDPEWVVLNAPSWDNPRMVEWLTKEKAKFFARGDEAEWMREFEAVYVAGGKRAIFPMFDPRRHVVPGDFLQSKLALDAGKFDFYTVFDPGTTSVFAVGFFAINRYTTELLCLGEIYETDPRFTTPRLMWERAREMEKMLFPQATRPLRIYDNAASWFATSIAVDYGEGLVPCDKESRSQEDDFGVIKDSMLSDKFFISEECTNGITEVSSLQRGDGGIIAQRSADHWVDTLRYCVRTAQYSVQPIYETARQTYSRMRGIQDVDLTPQTTNEVDFSFADDWITQ